MPLLRDLKTRLADWEIATRPEQPHQKYKTLGYRGCTSPSLGCFEWAGGHREKIKKARQAFKDRVVRASPTGRE